MAIRCHSCPVCMKSPLCHTCRWKACLILQVRGSVLARALESIIQDPPNQTDHSLGVQRQRLIFLKRLWMEELVKFRKVPSVLCRYLHSLELPSTKLHVCSDLPHLMRVIIGLIRLRTQLFSPLPKVASTLLGLEPSFCGVWVTEFNFFHRVIHFKSQFRVFSQQIRQHILA